MKTHARIVRSGNGMVGGSVLCHLTKKGCTDALPIEHRGVHRLNGDPNVAGLQKHIMDVRAEIEKLLVQELRPPPYRQCASGR